MAKNTVKITGIETVMKNLNAEAVKIAGKTMGGLIRGQILVRRDMSTKPPMIPIEFGNLEHSYFNQPFPSKNNPVLLLGFTADYAMAVHERKGIINWKKPGSGPKFLESALKNNTEAILQEMKNSVKY